MSANVSEAPPRQAAAGPTVAQLARAAALLSEDRLTDAQIAARLGVSRRTLARWKGHPLFGPMRLACSESFRLHLEREREARWRARRG